MSPCIGALTNFSHLTTTAYVVPVYVQTRQTFTGISFGINTSSTNLNVKLAAYVNTSGAPGAKVVGTDITSGPHTVGASTTIDAAFSAPVTFDPGWYWLAIQTDQNQSLFGVGSTSMMSMVGAVDMIQGGPRLTALNTYASGLPATFGALTRTVNQGSTYLGLKAQ